MNSAVTLASNLRTDPVHMMSSSRSASPSPPLPLRHRAGVQRLTRIFRKFAPGKPPSPLLSRVRRESGLTGSESRQQVLLSPCRLARHTAGVDASQSDSGSASSLVTSSINCVDTCRDVTMTQDWRRTSEPWSGVRSAPVTPARVVAHARDSPDARSRRKVLKSQFPCSYMYTVL